MYGFTRFRPGSSSALVRAALVFSFATLLLSMSAAAQFTVTKTADTSDGTCDADCSLREAVAAANANPGVDEILFAAALDGTPIVLDLTGTDEDLNADGDLDVTDPDGLVITGNGEANTILDGANDERVLEIFEGDLTITDLTIQNGSAGEGNSGAGIRMYAGDLVLDRVTVKDNTAGFGAGLYIRSSVTTVTLTNCTFSGNEATGGSGGAMRIGSSVPTTLVMDGCTVTDNVASSDGAGVDFDSGGGTLMIFNSIITGNRSGRDGGGVKFDANDDGSGTISNTQITGNEADHNGGGVYHESDGALLTIVNSTISGNRADESGGGLAVEDIEARLALNFVTVTDNVADFDGDDTGDGGGIDIPQAIGTAAVTIENSIVQGNDNATDGESVTDDCANSGGVGSYTSGGGNVFGDAAGCPMTTDDTTDDAHLGPLANNGGPTLTHTLLPGSAAIDFAMADTVTTDQRGFPRDAMADAGAVELNAVCDEDLTLISQADVEAFFCTIVTGTLTLADQPGSEIVDLAPLFHLKAVEGNFFINDNTQLTSLDGLEALTSVGGSLDIRSNDALGSLEALSNLASVGGDLTVRNNEILLSLDGLENVSTVGQDLTVFSNDVLSNCSCGLSGLISGEPAAFTEVTGTVTILSNASSGSCSSPQAVLEQPCLAPLTVTASLWLEGPWNGTDMETALSSVLPQDDPYDLNQSVESTTFFTDDSDGQQVVDWVWLELRTGDPTSPPMTGVAKTAALLMADGSIKAVDATSAVAFSEVEADAYYLVVGHRNHLAVMSAQPLDCSSGSCSYDFRGAQTQAYGSAAMAELGGGAVGLYAGDADGNGQVQNDDKNTFWSVQAGQAGYLSADFSLNAQVQNDDKNGLWNANAGRGTQVPDP